MAYEPEFEILNHWALYCEACEASATPATLQGFGAYLAALPGQMPGPSGLVTPPPEATKPPPGPTLPIPLPGGDWAAVQDFYRYYAPEDKVGIFIGRLFKFIRILFRHQMADMPHELNLDEFAFLLAVFFRPRPRIKDVMQMTFLEAAHASKMAAKLARLGLITEARNPDDARSKLLSLTPQGVALVQQGLPRLKALGQQSMAVLTPTELETLAALLERLNEHHTQQHLRGE